MESAKTLRVRMRLVARIDNRPPLHRIDTLQFAEEIAPLRYLKGGRDKSIFRFHRELSRPGNDLARDQKRLNPIGEIVPRQRTGQQVILMAAVAMAQEIRVVFVKPNL